MGALDIGLELDLRILAWTPQTGLKHKMLESQAGPGNCSMEEMKSCGNADGRGVKKH